MEEPTLNGSLYYFYVIGTLSQEQKLQAYGTVRNNDAVDNEIFSVKKRCPSGFTTRRSRDVGHITLLNRTMVPAYSMNCIELH